MTTDIIFLGIANRAVNIGFGTNLMGVSHTLLLPWLPQPLGGIRCLLGIRKSSAYSDGLAFTLEFKDDKHPDSTATIDCRVDRSPTVSTAETEEKVLTTEQPLFNAQTAMDSESFVLVASLAPPIVVIEPTSIAVSAIYNDRRLGLGHFAVAFATPAPLSDEERQAIMSNPVATKSTRLEFRCPLCNDRLAVYDRLKPDGKPIPRIDESAVYLHDAPDEWTCKCGKVTFPLQYLKAGMHHMFREVAPTAIGTAFTHSLRPLYERGQLREIYNAFQLLLNSTPHEEQVQEFIQKHPILWSFLTPVRIFHKPRILGKFTADFGVLTAQSILYFIEIEKPQTKLATVKGGLHSEVQQAFNQVRDWKVEISNHRAAVLDQLELSHQTVHDIRYIVIAGLQRDVDPVALTKLQQSIRASETQFYCFDELASLLHALDSQLGLI